LKSRKEKANGSLSYTGGRNCRRKLCTNRPKEKLDGSKSHTRSSVTAFLAGFTALSGAIYSGKALLYLVAVALIGVSIWAFRKAKPLEIQKMEELRLMMILVGILITLSGFVISVLSLALNSNAARLGVVSSAGRQVCSAIIGVLNRAYLKNAIWKKG